MTPLGPILARWAAELTYADLPDAVVADCKDRLLDTLGVALAAVDLPIGVAVRKAARALGSGDQATALGEGRNFDAATAALVNGTLAHAMDFDDTHNASVMHPSAPSVAAALAACEAAKADGRTLILAIAIGNELGCRLGLATPGAFHAVGLHPTSVLGTPAAAATAGRVFGLSAERIASAFGIAASQGSGVLEAYADGTWSKTLHPGWAAHAGIVAARLAQAGFTGPETAFDGRYGLFRALLPAGTEPDFAAASDGLGRNWIAPETSYKLYACAHSIHAFVEAAAGLRAAHGLTPDRIASVELAVPQGFVGQIAEPRAAKLAPRTSTHARASLFYAVAATLADGALTAAHYEGTAYTRADILSLAQRITHRAVPDSEPIKFSGGVRILATDGGKFEAYVDEADGTGARALSPERVAAKFRATAGSGLPSAKVERLIELVAGLDALPDVRTLMEATT
ncbi:MAG: MmgE/PrpD family protein [Tagaea sp.]|nr:MmgE/PrpD family protein [Tagaea sp.]